MIRIERDTLYTRADLAAMLAPAGVDVDHFIARLRPRKFLRMVWLGEDILAAMKAAPALEATGAPEVVEHPAGEVVELPAPANRGNRRRRPRSTARVCDPLAPLRKLDEELR